LNLNCYVDATSSPIRMLNSTYGFCTVQPMSTGIFGISTSNADSLTTLFFLTVVDRPTDLRLNVTAILSSVSTYVRASSASCSIPLGIFCASSDADVKVIYADKCTFICLISPGAQSSPYPFQSALSSLSRVLVKTISIRLCLSSSCDYPLMSSSINVLPPSVIAAIMPYTGSSLGGTTVSLLGLGFVNDGNTRIVFGDNRNINNTVTAITISSTRIVCISPPGMSNVRISVYRGDVIVSTSSSMFEYVALLSNVRTNTSTVLSTGGTAVALMVPKMSGLVNPIGK
jgi:IPT/TIG domain